MASLDALYSLLSRIDESCSSLNGKNVDEEISELVAMDISDVSSMKAVGLKIPKILESFPNTLERLFNIHLKILECDNAIRGPCLDALKPVLMNNDSLMMKYVDTIVEESYGPNKSFSDGLLSKVVENNPISIIGKLIDALKLDVKKPFNETKFELVKTYKDVCKMSKRLLRKNGTGTCVQIKDLIGKVVNELSSSVEEEDIVVLSRLLRHLFKLPSPTVKEDVVIIIIKTIDSMDPMKTNPSCFNIIQSANGNPVLLSTSIISKAKSISEEVKTQNGFCWLLSLALALSSVLGRATDQDAVLGSINVLFCAIGKIIRKRGVYKSVDMFGLFIARKVVSDVLPAVLYREYGTQTSWNGWILEVANNMLDTIVAPTAESPSPEGFRFVSPLKSNDFNNLFIILVECCRLAPLSKDDCQADDTLVSVSRSKLELLARYIAQFILPRKPDTILEIGKKEETVSYDETVYGPKDEFVKLSKILLSLIGEHPHLPTVNQGRSGNIPVKSKMGGKATSARAKRSPEGARVTWKNDKK